MLPITRSAGKVLLLPPDKIDASPFQARREFAPGEIRALADSIAANGLLQPISVRRAGGRYQLVAGERRLRACQLLGMTQVPAILCEFDDAQTAALGLLENLQREDLNPFEQARGLQELIGRWGCTQAAAAQRLGMAQPTLANKLRLLQLTDNQQAYVLQQGLTERHARSVLRLPAPERDRALCYIARHRLSARAADTYVEQLLHTAARPRRVPMIRDVRIFVNTINHAIRVMTDNGVPASTSRTEHDGYIEYTVRIPTGSAAGGP